MTPTQKHKILLIGCGKMGGALLNGWNNHLADNFEFEIVDRSYHAATYRSIEEVSNPTFDSIILAVKPQMLDDVMPRIVQKFGIAPLYISVAAGKTVRYFSQFFGSQSDHTKIVRVMPNTPSLIGKGMSGLFASSNVSLTEKDMCTQLMQAVGKILWLDDEAKIDSITAISGSGPAYIFHFMECLIGAATAQGFSIEEAELIVKQLVEGSVSLANNSDIPLKELRENVTSKGGTTAAALDVFMHNPPETLQSLVQKAAQAAHDRSVELAT